MYALFLLKAFGRSDERGEMALSLSKGCRKAYRLSIKLQILIIFRDMPAWFYILRLRSGSLYIGATTNLETRYKTHQNRLAARTTTLDPVVSLVYSEEHESFSKARQREAQVKRWSRAKKEALVAGDKDKLRALSKSQND